MPFRTLSERVAAPPELHSGVPDHLRESLVAVVSRWCLGSDYRALSPSKVLLLEREARVPRLLEIQGVGVIENTAVLKQNLRRAPPEQLLALVDAIVRISPEAAESVNELLTQAGSEFEVRALDVDGNQVHGLERRVSRELADTLDGVPDLRARRELGEARASIYGRDPDFEQGMNRAVKAVEHVSIGVVEPNNAKATLGTVTRALLDRPEQFTSAVGNPNAVGLMCQSLWDAERVHRHGTPEERAPDPPTRQQAEAAFSLAVLLCDWFSRGVITKR